MQTRLYLFEIHQVIKYVLNTICFGLKLEPKQSEKEPSKIVLFSNSVYAGDPVTRSIISCFILFVLDVPVSWRSKAQRILTLSSLEAKWMALLEAIKKSCL